MSENNKVKTVCLVVPEDFELPPFSATPENCRKIIEYGIEMLNAKDQILLGKLEKNKLESLKKMYETELTVLKATIEANQIQMDIFKRQNIENKKEDFNNGFTAGKEQLQSLVDHYRGENDKKNEEIHKLHDKIAEVHLTSHAAYHPLLKDMQINNAFLERFKTDTAFKGKIGEDCTMNILKHHFCNPRINVTRSVDGLSDFHLFIGKLKLMVENKNNKKSLLIEYKRFKENVEKHSSSEEINAAIYVSMNDTSLPDTKESFKFDMINGIPSFYIANTLNDPHSLCIMASTLKFIIDNNWTGRSASETVSYHTLSIFVGRALKMYKEEKDELKNLTKMLEDLRSMILKKQQRILDYEGALQQVYLSHPELNNTTYTAIYNSSTNMILEDALSNIGKYFQEHNKEPTADDLIRAGMMSKTQIEKLGGMRHLKNEFQRQSKRTPSKVNNENPPKKRLPPLVIMEEKREETEEKENVEEGEEEKERGGEQTCQQETVTKLEYASNDSISRIKLKFMTQSTEEFLDDI